MNLWYRCQDYWPSSIWCILKGKILLWTSFLTMMSRGKLLGVMALLFISMVLKKVLECPSSLRLWMSSRHWSGSTKRSILEPDSIQIVLGIDTQQSRIQIHTAVVPLIASKLAQQTFQNFYVKVKSTLTPTLLALIWYTGPITIHMGNTQHMKIRLIQGHTTSVTGMKCTRVPISLIQMAPSATMRQFRAVLERGI